MSGGALVADLFSPPVEVAEAFADLDGVPLFPEERAVLTHAVRRRRREFATVRACARTALARLGTPPAALVPGPSGAPSWPPGFVGSMTHCPGYRAAAVAPAATVASLGLDAEPDEPLPFKLGMVAVEEERSMVAVLLDRRPDVRWDRLLFSAKESVYKAWYPLTGSWLDFDQAVITFEADSPVFTARLLVPGPVVSGVRLAGFEGAWSACRGLLVTAVTVPADPALAGSG
ncbi:4'-phosphopantetheinyl transferase family protein [Kitasatospora sp. NPDC001119]|uniref:4'-phosphopantetheinyl transferase family protein n=1 Tax=Kitasatospora sp. NPDC057512 TaxID=3346154 RepID=UPI0036A1C1F5